MGLAVVEVMVAEEVVARPSGCGGRARGLSFLLPPRPPPCWVGRQPALRCLQLTGVKGGQAGLGSVRALPVTRLFELPCCRSP